MWKKIAAEKTMEAVSTEVEKTASNKKRGGERGVRNG